MTFIKIEELIYFNWIENYLNYFIKIKIINFFFF